MWGVVRRVSALVSIIGLAAAVAPGGALGGASRQAHERIPVNARVLKVTARNIYEGEKPHTLAVVTRLRKIRRVAQVIDFFPLTQVGVCSEGFVQPGIFFTFLASIKGPVLARVAGVAKGLAGAACEPTSLWVRGQGSQWLVEDSDLLQKVNRILGASLR
jgi:hypothetical protein